MDATEIGPFTLSAKLGDGVMGELFVGENRELGGEVVVRILPEELCENEDRRARFLRIARKAAGLEHPNIARIVGVDEDDGRGYIAFERLSGRTLAVLLAERSLSAAEVLDLGLPLAEALSYGHSQGVIHRELTPANVMVTDDGSPRLLDFGLAKLKDVARRSGLGEESSAITMSDSIFGTPAAMSPEQVLGRRLDERSEVFSFGSLLYEMAAGKPAFPGRTLGEVLEAVVNNEPEPLAKLRRDFLPDFLAVVEKAQSKDRDDRYGSMAELAEELRRCERPTGEVGGRRGLGRFLSDLFSSGRRRGR